MSTRCIQLSTKRAWIQYSSRNSFVITNCWRLWLKCSRKDLIKLKWHIWPRKDRKIWSTHRTLRKKLNWKGPNVALTPKFSFNVHSIKKIRTFLSQLVRTNMILIKIGKAIKRNTNRKFQLLWTMFGYLTITIENKMLLGRIGLI